jgi:hypothetical protein
MKAKDNRTRWVHLRLTPTEYRQLQSRFKRTTCRKLSDYLRAALLERPVITTYRNISIDGIMAELSVLNKELNAVGNNINQMAKKMHTIRLPEMQHWSAQFDMLSGQFFTKMEEVKDMVGNLAERWLR